MRPDDIRDRAAAIRLSNKALAVATGLVENTIGRTLCGRTSPNLTTCDLLGTAVLAEEIRLRDYLLALHPVVPAEIKEPA
jgi:predicted transcriptional regulator